MPNHLPTKSLPDTSARPLRGVFPILSSPFGERGALDIEGLGRLTRFVIDKGAHGVVYPAIASEFATLSAQERRDGVDAVAAAAAGKCPLIVGISDRAPEQAAAHAAQAAHAGAAAVMLMAPRSAGESAEDVGGFFERALGGVALPVVMQNAPPPLGSSLSIETVREVCRRLPSIRYVKEEVVPCGQRISALLAGVPGLSGVFGGAGGRFVLDELTRGSAGSMPACEVPELHVAVFEAFEAGRRGEARAIFNALLPLLNLGSAYRTPVTKHALVRRGVIASCGHRDSNPRFDPYDLAEFGVIWDELAPRLGAAR